VIGLHAYTKRIVFDVYSGC